MEKWFIRYSVRLELSERPIEFGIVCAENLGEAAKKLEDFYGPDLIEILQLRYLEEGLILLPKEVVDSIEEAVESYG